MDHLAYDNATDFTKADFPVWITPDKGYVQRATTGRYIFIKMPEGRPTNAEYRLTEKEVATLIPYNDLAKQQTNLTDPEV